MCSSRTRNDPICGAAAEVANPDSNIAIVAPRYNGEEAINGSNGRRDETDVAAAAPSMARIYHWKNLCLVADPNVVGIAEEAIGGEARLMQSDAHIRRPRSDKEDSYGFHRGLYTILGGSQQNGLYQYPFVKVLTNLTDLGPDDGGTAVIAGTHKLPHVPNEELIAAAREDPSLIHTVVAPAGSALLFYEALVHSSGIIRSGRDRALIIGGYTRTMFVPEGGYDPYPPFLEQLPESYRALLDGTRRWQMPKPSETRFRRLDEPVGTMTAKPGTVRQGQ